MASKKLSVAVAEIRNSELNEDVLIEILWRLPTKHLFQLMCVSTSWRRIMSAVVYSRRRRVVRRIFGFFIQWNYHLGVVHNCMLLRKEAAVAFESPVSLHYKVFRFFGPSGKRDSRRIYAEVFSSTTGEWATRKMDFPVKSLCDQRAVFLEGPLYLQSYKHVAVRVEVMEERRLVVELPTYKAARAKCSIQERLGVCQGRLHYACRDGPWLRIWMAGGGGGWVLKHSVRIHDIQHALVGNVTVLGFHPDEDMIYVRIRRGVESIQFNEDGTKSYGFELHHIRSKEDAEALWFWVYPFSESLHPVAVDRHVGP
ncbi:hypothetical protein ACLOJK_002661 [Asimina triloba]